MRLAVFCTLLVLVSRTLAVPLISTTASSTFDAREGWSLTRSDDSIQLVRRGPKGKWIHVSEVQEHDKIKVQKEKKSLSRRISHGLVKKPMLSFSIIASGLLAANTWIVADTIRRREEKVMLLKKQKGELPVNLPEPTAKPKEQDDSKTSKPDVEKPPQQNDAAPLDKSAGQDDGI